VPADMRGQRISTRINFECILYTVIRRVVCVHPGGLGIILYPTIILHHMQNVQTSKSMQENERLGTAQK
jgi:hypothetical protein